MEYKLGKDEKISSKEIPILVIIIVMTIIMMIFGLAAWVILVVSIILFWGPILLLDFVKSEKFLEICHFTAEFSLVFLLCLIGLIVNIVIIFPKFIISWLRQRYRNLRYSGNRLLFLTAALLESKTDKDRIKFSLKIQRILKKLGSYSDEWRMVKELLDQFDKDVIGLKVFLSGMYLVW